MQPYLYLQRLERIWSLFAPERRKPEEETATAMRKGFHDGGSIGAAFLFERPQQLKMSAVKIAMPFVEEAASRSRPLDQRIFETLSSAAPWLDTILRSEDAGEPTEGTNCVGEEVA